MKKIELFIPDRRLDDVTEILKDADVGGMSQYRIEGRGKVKPEEINVGRGTMTYKPKFIPRTKVEVVVSDKKVETLITAFRNRLGDNMGGKLFVIEVAKALDLSTGKVDENAIWLNNKKREFPIWVTGGIKVICEHTEFRENSFCRWLDGLSLTSFINIMITWSPYIRCIIGIVSLLTTMRYSFQNQIIWVF